MAATPSVKIVKTFPYKGGTKTYSNRYHFSGGTPADASHWNTLFDAVVAAEKSCYGSTVTITSAVGYAAGSDLPVASKSYTTVGTIVSPGTLTPGDCAVLLRWSTAARSVKNHPIYLFNYFHPAYRDSTDPDKPSTAQGPAIDAYAGTWIGAGFSDGVNSYKRAGPQGANATGHNVETYITHRDFPK